MTEFALLIYGALREIRHYDERPADISHKRVSWHPVVRVWTVLPTLDELRARKLAELAGLCWEKETGGNTYNGMPGSTNAVSQTKYIGAVVGVQIDLNAVINWKIADGTFVALDAQAITAVAMAVRAHVQACFDREAVLKAEIEAATMADGIAALDLNTGWP
jgi:hypothetical protein